MIALMTRILLSAMIIIEIISSDARGFYG